MKDLHNWLRLLSAGGAVVALLAALPVQAQQTEQQGGSASAETGDAEIIAAAPARDASGGEAPAAAESAEPEETAAQQRGRAGTLQVNPFQVEDRSVFGGARAYGDIQIAYQSVNVDGSESRFRKDWGFNDGVRIKNSSVTFVPHGDDAAGWFDRVQLYGDNVGGNDKYQSWGVQASKAGSYKLDVRDRRLNWFNDISGEANAWNLTRHMTNANLAVNLTSDLVVNGRFNRFSQTDGDDTPTDGGNFVEPFDQTGTDWGVGLRWRIGQTVLFANQDFRKFENNGIAEGRIEDLREMSAPVTRGGFNTRVADGAVRISGDILYSKQDMDFGSALSAGSGNVEGGNAEREILHGNVRVAWNASDRVNVYAQYRRRGWDQDASKADSPTAAPDDLTSYEITLNQVFGGVEWAVTRGISLFGEVGTGSRDQQFMRDSDGTDFTTDAFGARFGGRFRANSQLDGSVSFELGDIDNAFTRISPTKANTFRAKVRYRPAHAWTIAATARISSSENDCGQFDDDGTCEYGSGGLFAGEYGIAEFDTRNFGVTVNYTLDAGRWLYAGYTYLDYESNVPIYFVLMSSGNFVSDIAEYDSRADVFTFGGEYLVSDSVPLSLYGRLNITSNSGTYPVSFDDIGVGVRYVLPMGLFADVSGRFGKYDDDSALLSMVDDYTSQVYTFGLGYRF